jgi:zinc protease
LQGFAQLPIEEPVRPVIDELPAIEGRHIYLVNMPGAAQSSVRAMHHSVKYDALGKFHQAGLANFTLGGTSASRINLNLREDKGYTYGAFSSFQGGKDTGSFAFSSEINKDATAPAILELFTELEDYQANGMTEAEFEFMRNAISQREARQYETPTNKLGLVSNILRYDLPLDFRTQQKHLLQETDRETLNRLMAELLDPQNMAIVVVGDEAVIRPDLEELGLPITTLNEDGYPVSP